MKLLRPAISAGVLVCASYLLGQTESLVIGPGDELHVQVFDTPTLDETARVTDAGDLPLILGGSIHVASLTPEQSAKALEMAFIEKRIMNHPQVLVTVVKFATQNVSVFGQVLKPGAYPIETPRPVIEVLTLAGGLTDVADRHIVVERHASGQNVSYFVPNSASASRDETVMVYPGDRIVVPKAGIVYVLGDVGRPGGFPMATNDSGLTVLQAVALAGAALPTASPGHTRLVRRGANGALTEIPVPLAAMEKGKAPDMKLEADDIIYVPFSFMRNAALGVTGLAAAATSAIINAK